MYIYTYIYAQRKLLRILSSFDIIIFECRDSRQGTLIPWIVCHIVIRNSNTTVFRNLNITQQFEILISNDYHTLASKVFLNFSACIAYTSKYLQILNDWKHKIGTTYIYIYTYSHISLFLSLSLSLSLPLLSVTRS